MKTTPEGRRTVRLTATAAALLGLTLTAAAYAAGGPASLAIAPLVGGALITHYALRPGYSNGRAA